MGKQLHKAPLPTDWRVFPSLLVSIPRWILWDYFEADEPGKKPRKVPLARSRDVAANYLDPENWLGVHEAFEQAARRRVGVGWVFDPEDRVVGVDLDDAILPSGELKPWAEEIFSRFETWAEKSPSGLGLHILGRGDPVVGKTRAKISETEGVERYSGSRWFAFTGDVLKPGKVLDVREALAWLDERHFRQAPPAKPAPPLAGSLGAHAPDPELDLAVARVCLDLLKVDRAFEGEDWRRVGYALKGTSEELAGDWHRFSARWSNYSERECADRWSRFRPGEVGLQTLIGMACDDSGRTASDIVREARSRLGPRSTTLPPYREQAAPVEPQEPPLDVARRILGTVSSGSPEAERREAVDRVLEAAASCRGPRAALDVEDLLRLAAERTGYSREALEALALQAREKAEERLLRDELGRELSGLAGVAGEGKEPAGRLLARARDVVEDLQARSVVVPLPPVFDVESLEREARLVRPGFSTGWEELDANRVRLRPKELVGVAARPGQGKTSVLVWLLWQLLRQTDDGVVVFATFEETALSLLYRLYALAAAELVPEETELSSSPTSTRWNRGDVRDWLAGTLDGVGGRGVSRERIELLARAKELVAEKTRRLVVIEERSAGADRVANLCRAVHDVHGCRGVLVDYLQRLPHDGPELAGGRRDLETAWACRRLRERIALPFECPVVVAAQVNREALRDGWSRRLLEALDPKKAKRGSSAEESIVEWTTRVERILRQARPSPHMLRDGGIEHEADLILGTHNPSADLAIDRDAKATFTGAAWAHNRTPLDVGVLKNRSGTDGEWIRLVGDYGAGRFTTPTAAESDLPGRFEEFDSAALDDEPFGD